MASDRQKTEEINTPIKHFQEIIEDLQPEPWLDIPVLIPKMVSAEDNKENHKP